MTTATISSSSVRVVYDAFVCDPIQVDLDPTVYQAWLQGIKASVIIAQRKLAIDQLYDTENLETPEISQSKQQQQQQPSQQQLQHSQDIPKHPPSLTIQASISTASSNPSPAPSPSPTSPHHLSVLQHHPPQHFQQPVRRTSTLFSSSAPATELYDPDDSGGTIQHQNAELDAEADTVLLTHTNAKGRLAQALARDIQDQYRVYNMLEHSLRKPLLLQRNCTFQLSDQQQQMMVEGYYEYDHSFMRLLMGFKLNSKTRSLVVDMAWRCNLLPSSCLRQFDNLRRIFRCRVGSGTEGVTEREGLWGRPMPSMRGMLNITGSALSAPASTRSIKSEATEEEIEGDEEIDANALAMPATLFYQRLFHVSADLARQYTRLVFLCRYRFETIKKPMLACSYEDLDYIAQLLITNWCNPLPFNPMYGRPPPPVPAASTSTQPLTPAVTLFPPSQSLAVAATPGIGAVHVQSSTASNSPNTAQTAPPVEVTSIAGGVPSLSQQLSLSILNATPTPHVRVLTGQTASTPLAHPITAGTTPHVHPHVPPHHPSHDPASARSSIQDSSVGVDVSVAVTNVTTTTLHTFHPHEDVERNYQAGDLFRERTASVGQAPAQPHGALTRNIGQTSSGSASASASASPSPSSSPSPSTSQPPSVPSSGRSSVIRTWVATPAHATRAILEDDEWAGDTLDMDFINMLRELKTFLSGDRKLMDEYAIAVFRALNESDLGRIHIRATHVTKLSQRFNHVIRGLMNVSFALPKNKKIRFLMIDLLEEVVRPLLRLGLRPLEVDLFLSKLDTCFANMPAVKLKIKAAQQANKPDLSSLYLRYLSAVLPICSVLYSKLSSGSTLDVPGSGPSQGAAPPQAQATATATATAP